MDSWDPAPVSGYPKWTREPPNCKAHSHLLVTNPLQGLNLQEQLLCSASQQFWHQGLESAKVIWCDRGYLPGSSTWLLSGTALGADSWNSLPVALLRFTRKQPWLLLALLGIFLSPQPSALRAVQWLRCEPATAFPTAPTREANSCAAPVMWTADTSWM